MDENSTVYGPWSTASDGYWSAYPDIELPAGTYTVIDSEPGSWSFNNESGNAGMTEIVGYTVITGAERLHAHAAGSRRRTSHYIRGYSGRR